MIEVFADANATEIDMDDKFDESTGIRYIGVARKQFDGTWRCAAVVGVRSLCIVQVIVKPTMIIDRDPGDEDRPRT